MPFPTTAGITQRPELASMLEFDILAAEQGFVAGLVLPSLDVAHQSNDIGKLPIEELLKEQLTARTSSGGYNRNVTRFEKFSYATEEHGVEEVVDDRDREIWREYLDADEIAMRRAADRILRAYEKRVADAVFDTATWSTAALKTAVTNEWDDATNATPISDVNDAIKKVYDNSGLRANTLIINWKVYRNLIRVAQIIDQVKYSGMTNPNQLSPNVLAEVFNIDRVIVAGSVRNSAAEGQVATVSPVWSNEFAMICKTAMSRDPREACIGRTFHFAADGSQINGVVEQYRDEPVRADIFRVRHETDEVIMYAQAGHLLENITT